MLHLHTTAKELHKYLSNKKRSPCLVPGCRGADKTTEWLRYFDVIMVGCGKPGFFGPSGQLFHVDVKTGGLQASAG